MLSNNTMVLPQNQIRYFDSMIVRYLYCYELFENTGLSHLEWVNGSMRERTNVVHNDTL